MSMHEIESLVEYSNNSLFAIFPENRSTLDSSRDAERSKGKWLLSSQVFLGLV